MKINMKFLLATVLIAVAITCNAQYYNIPEDLRVNKAGKNTLLALGDSFTVGTNASPLSLAYAPLCQKFIGLGAVLTSTAVGGRGVWNQASAIQTAVFTRTTTIISVMVGLNDVRRNGSAANTLKKIEAGYRSIILRGISNVNTPAGDATVTRTGTHTGFSASSVGGLYPNTPIPGASSTQASALGASWTYNFTGTGFGIQFNASDGVNYGYGTCKVYVDGTVDRVIDLKNWYDGVSDGAYDNTRGPLAFTWHNLANTSHVIKVECNGDGAIPVDYFCTLNDPSGSPSFLFWEIPYLNSTGYALAPSSGSTSASDAASAVIYSLALDYKRLGFDMGWGRTNSCYSLTNGVDADNIHPNTIGHAQTAAAGYAAMRNN